MLRNPTRTNKARKKKKEQTPKPQQHPCTNKRGGAVRCDGLHYDPYEECPSTFVLAIAVQSFGADRRKLKPMWLTAVQLAVLAGCGGGSGSLKRLSTQYVHRWVSI